MKEVFSIRSLFQVPDGTLVEPFLNSKDEKSQIPFDLLEDYSIAAGVIQAKTSSRIQVMPSGTRVTFVRTGSLRIKMKAEFDVEPYDLELTADQAVVTAPGTLLQLINDTLESCHVLYIVSPAYLVLLNDDHVVYDDSIILGEDWDNVTCVRWNSQELQIARHEAYIELAAKKVRKS